MKLYISLLALSAIAFSSCSTAYKAGQTPDDVYFSPARGQDEYVVVAPAQDRSYRGSDYYEDRYLRNRIQNRYRWSALDDYYNNPYAFNSFGYYNSWNNPWNNYWTWNSFYNPYYGGGGIIIKNPRNYTPPSRAVVFNPTSYSNTASGSSSRGYKPQPYGVNNGARYNNSNNSRSNNNNNSTLGGSIRRAFSGSNNNDNNSSRSRAVDQTPTRTYNPPASSGSSGGRSSSGGSSSGGSRPIR